MATAEAPTTTGRLQSVVLGLLAAILLLTLIGMIVGGLYLLRRSGLLAPTYAVTVRVQDAGGVTAGASVQMAGVPVGLVEQAAVQDGRAVLRLRINREDAIPAGSRLAISPALFSMPASVKIIPPAAEAARLSPVVDSTPDLHLSGAGGGDAADPLARADALMAQWTQVGSRTSELLAETTRTTRRLDALMGDGDTRRRLRATLADVQTASRDGAQVTAQLADLLRRDGPPSQALLAHLSEASGQFSAMARAGRPQVARILADTAGTTHTVAQVTSQGNRMLQAATRGGPPGKPSAATQLAGTLRDLSATVANLKDLTGKMSAIAGNVQAVSSDPEVAGDFKGVLHHLQSTTAHADALTGSAQTLVGDPQVQADLKTTLHNLSTLTDATAHLVTLLGKAAEKAH